MDLKDIAEQHGYQLREVQLGFFLEPVSRNRFGHRSVGDSQMLIRHDGTIIPYTNNAQAFIAARAVSRALAGLAVS